MRSKNKPAMTSAEREHVDLVRQQACVLCDALGPNEAHEPIQGQWFLSIAVCPDCHRGPRGIHGDQTMLRLRFRIAGTHGELRAINETMRRVARLRRDA